MIALQQNSGSGRSACRTRSGGLPLIGALSSHKLAGGSGRRPFNSVRSLLSDRRGAFNLCFRLPAAFSHASVGAARDLAAQIAAAKSRLSGGRG